MPDLTNDQWFTLYTRLILLKMYASKHYNEVLLPAIIEQWKAKEEASIPST